MIAIGELSLWVALLTSAWSLAMSISAVVRGGWREDHRESGRRALLATFAMLLLASTGLCAGFLTSDFTRTYVAAHSNSNLPRLYAVAALWAGSAGWLMLLATALSGLASLVVGTPPGRSTRNTARVATGLGVPLVTALAIVCFALGPFAQFDYAVSDGRGLDAGLQNVGFVIIPPLEALAYALVIVSCALVLDPEARARAAAWMRRAGLVLSLAVVARVWWTYTALEGGGTFWRWGLGECATLALWLIVEALRHDLGANTVPQRNVASIPAVVAPVLAAVGIVFGGASSMLEGALPGDEISSRLIVAAAIVAVASVALLRSVRRPSTSTSRDSSPTLPHQSRRIDAATVGMATLVALAAMVAIAALAPTVQTWVEGKSADGTSLGDASAKIIAPVLLAVITFSPRSSPRHAQPWRLRTIAPPLVLAGLGVVALTMLHVTSLYALFTAALSILALCMLARDFVIGGARTASRFLVHVGIVLAVVGLCFATLTTHRDLTVRSGETFETRDPFGRRWKFVGQGVSLYDVLNRRVIAVTLDAFREGASVGLVKTEKRQFVDDDGASLGEPLTGIGLLRTALEDVRLELQDASGEVAKVRLSFLPFVGLVWVGAVFVVVGGVADVGFGTEDE